MEDHKSCEHCEEEIIIPVLLEKENKTHFFCCQGCKTVFEILEENNLQDYYKLRGETSEQKNGPVTLTNQKYKYLDEEEFLNTYATINEKTITMKFYLKGIHCLACLWLIEKLPSLLPSIVDSKLDMSKSTAEITIIKGSHFSEAAKLLENLGYPPHPIIENKEIESLRKKEDQKELIKIAIAFFCTGNIMLMSYSIYAGADGGIKQYFDWLSLILTLPVITYCSTSFYKNAISSVKQRSLSIDFPIVIALILGTLLSIRETLIGGENIYYDTLATLIFLLLTSRFILKKTQQKGLSASDVSSFFSNITTTLIENGQEKEIFAKFLNPDDTILVRAGETIPVDGTIIDGHSSINNSLLTGEVFPQEVKKGDDVFSGTINNQSDLKVLVKKAATDSKLGVILKSVEKGWHQKSEIIHITDQIAKRFVIAVFSISVIAFIYFSVFHSIETGVLRALTIIIITCPCALGLTTPLSLTLTLARLAAKGIIVKDEMVIEKINQAKTIVFDKTGTLTHGKFIVTELVGETDNKTLEVLYSLESRSQHPIAKSISEHLKLLWKKNGHIAHLNLEVENFEEIPGVGPRAIINNSLYQIVPLENKNSDQTACQLIQDDKAVLTIYLKDKVFEDANTEIKKIKKLSLNPFILSGDNQGVVSKVAKEIGIEPNQALGNQKPQDKLDFIETHDQTIMVGDGANDAMALSHSWVGVAVHGSVDISLRASSVFMSQPNIANITKLILVCKETIKVIKRNLLFSLFYNIIGVILALNGLITPFTAAIIMPLSSITVLLSTVFSTKNMREQLK